MLYYILHNNMGPRGCYITHFTTIRALTSMYTRMLYETTLVTECLITQITNIRAHTSM